MVRALQPEEHSIRYNKYGLYIVPKALASHGRRLHGIRSPLRFSAGADGRCQACNTVFASRVALLNHLGDTRRPRCKEWCEANGEKLTVASVKALDEADKIARREAVRAGGSTPVVQRAAYKHGKTVGRSQRAQ